VGAAKSIKLLLYRLLGVELGVLECVDITDYFAGEPGERFYIVEYYYRGVPLSRVVKFSGEWSEDPVTRRLQEHCVERRGALGSLRALLRFPRIRGQRART
jgi:hypothetical protein